MNTATFIFAFLISAACFWMSLKIIRLYLRVKKWQRVTAKILSKEVILHPKNAPPKAPYGLEVTYTYEINQTPYTGHTIYVVELAGGQVNRMKQDAEKRLAEIKMEMPVWVNPANPKQAVMYGGGIAMYLLIFSLGILSFLVGLSALLG